MAAVARIGSLLVVVGLAACSSDAVSPDDSEASLSEATPMDTEGDAGGSGADAAGSAGQGGSADAPNPTVAGGVGGVGGADGAGGGASNAGGEAGTSDAATPSTGVATDEQFFLPWDSFAPVGDGEPLRAPLEVRWVATGSVRNGENLVVAIATESGDNRIATLSAVPDAELRVFRDHGIDFACGDCEMAAMGSAVAVATESQLYGSSDGGESYFEIAPLDEAVERLVITGGRVYARTSSGWAFAPLDEAQVLEPLPWTHAVAHIYDDVALELTDDEVRLLLPAESLSGERPCAAPDISEPFATGRYDTRVIVACADGAVAISEDFPATPFSIWDLGDDVVWVGSSFYVATAESWYSTTTNTEGHRVGAQTALVEGERVWGYAEGARVAFRVTSHGVGWTYTGMISEL